MEQSERDRLTTLEALHKSRHEENQKSLKKIDDTVVKIFDKLDGLQCQTHAEKMKGIYSSLSVHAKVLFLIGGSILALAFAVIKWSILT